MSTQENAFISPDGRHSQLESRQAFITDRPCRIEPLTREEYGDEEIDLVNGIRAKVGAPPLQELPDYFAIMIRQPRLMQKQIELSLELMQGMLPPRFRQLAILRVAWLNQAPYEWGEHVAASQRLGVLDSEEVERITVGPQAPGWSSLERAVLVCVAELLGGAMVSDATWATLAEGFDEPQLLELLILIGTYQGIAYLQNAVRFRLGDGNQGLHAR